MQKKTKTFIKTLYNIVKDEKNKEIIRWSEDGTFFFILDTNTFSKEILSIYFKHKNISSFVRQLYKYDFHKISANKLSKEVCYNPNVLMHAYEHKHFIENGDDNLFLVQRKKIGSLYNGVLNSKNPINFLETQNYILNSLKTLSENIKMILAELMELKNVMKMRNGLEINAIVYEPDVATKNLIVEAIRKCGFTAYVADTVEDMLSIFNIINGSLVILSKKTTISLELVTEIRKSQPGILIFVVGKQFTESELNLYKNINVNCLIKANLSREKLEGILGNCVFTNNRMNCLNT